MDNEEEVANKVDKPEGNGKQKNGSKTKEVSPQMVVVGLLLVQLHQILVLQCHSKSIFARCNYASPITRFNRF